MTKAEQRKLERLEIENAELRKQNAKHIQVYGELISELIDLRTKLEQAKRLFDEMKEIAG